MLRSKQVQPQGQPKQPEFVGTLDVGLYVTGTPRMNRRFQVRIEFWRRTADIDDGLRLLLRLCPKRWCAWEDRERFSAVAGARPAAAGTDRAAHDDSRRGSIETPVARLCDSNHRHCKREGVYVAGPGKKEATVLQEQTREGKRL